MLCFLKAGGSRILNITFTPTFSTTYFQQQALEAGVCVTGDRGDKGHRADWDRDFEKV